MQMWYKQRVLGIAFSCHSWEPCDHIHVNKSYVACWMRRRHSSVTSVTPANSQARTRQVSKTTACQLTVAQGWAQTGSVEEQTKLLKFTNHRILSKHMSVFKLLHFSVACLLHSKCWLTQLMAHFCPISKGFSVMIFPRQTFLLVLIDNSGEILVKWNLHPPIIREKQIPFHWSVKN